MSRVEAEIVSGAGDIQRLQSRRDDGGVPRPSLARGWLSGKALGPVPAVLMLSLLLLSNNKKVALQFANAVVAVAAR